MNNGPRTVMTADEISRAVARMAHQVVELPSRAPDTPQILLGIPTRGVPLAHRLAAHLTQISAVAPVVGELDITMYRDDLRRQPTRAVGRTSVPVSVDGADVILVDDVVSTGRTVLAALEALRDLGRVSRVRLVALVDRGNRELPIRPDVVGLGLAAGLDERVQVHLSEIDELDEVIIERARTEAV